MWLVVITFAVSGVFGMTLAVAFYGAWWCLSGLLSGLLFGLVSAQFINKNSNTRSCAAPVAGRLRNGTFSLGSFIARATFSVTSGLDCHPSLGFFVIYQQPAMWCVKDVLPQGHFVREDWVCLPPRWFWPWNDRDESSVLNAMLPLPWFK